MSITLAIQIFMLSLCITHSSVSQSIDSIYPRCFLESFIAEFIDCLFFHLQNMIMIILLGTDVCHIISNNYLS